jgi:hypothetical protein
VPAFCAGGHNATIAAHNTVRVMKWLGIFTRFSSFMIRELYGKLAHGQLSIISYYFAKEDVKRFLSGALQPLRGRPCPMGRG